MRNCLIFSIVCLLGIFSATIHGAIQTNLEGIGFHQSLAIRVPRPVNGTAPFTLSLSYTVSAYAFVDVFQVARAVYPLDIKLGGIQVHPEPSIELPSYRSTPFDLKLSFSIDSSADPIE